MSNKQSDTNVYEVGFFYEESGVTWIEAKDEEDAKLKVYQSLEEKGLDGMNNKTQGREYGATSAKKL